LLVKFPSGITHEILWDKNQKPPKQKWWNKTTEEWIPLKKLICS